MNFFLGRYAVEQMYKASKEEGLSFAVAGRNESKLIAALEVITTSVRCIIYRQIIIMLKRIP